MKRYDHLLQIYRRMSQRKSFENRSVFDKSYVNNRYLRRTGIRSVMHVYDTGLTANEKLVGDRGANVKLIVHFCAGISGFSARSTVIVWTKVCSDADVDGNVLIGGVCEPWTQPKETLMCGRTFDSLATECHLYVMLHVNLIASFSATDECDTTGPQVGLEAEMNHNRTNKKLSYC